MDANDRQAVDWVSAPPFLTRAQQCVRSHSSSVPPSLLRPVSLLQAPHLTGLHNELDPYSRPQVLSLLLLLLLSIASWASLGPRIDIHTGTRGSSSFVPISGTYGKLPVAQTYTHKHRHSKRATNKLRPKNAITGVTTTLYNLLPKNYFKKL